MKGLRLHCIFPFWEGYARVKINEIGWNFIDTKGNLLSKKWCDWCGDFQEGYARFKLNGKYNHIDTEGNLLSPNQWWDYCCWFQKGCAKVELDEKGINYIDTNGNLKGEWV